MNVRKGKLIKTVKQEAALLSTQRYNERQKEIIKTPLRAVLFLSASI